MPRYALVRIADGFIDRLATDIDPTVETKSGWKWLPCALAVLPAYDLDTHILEGPVRVVGATEVTETFTTRLKTAEELDAAKDAILNGMDASRAVRIALYDLDKRLLVVEAQSARTPAQYRTYIKSKL